MPKAYDEKYGDDKLCKCGHPYYRHFDTYTENMEPIGCKYCSCDNFNPINGDLPQGEDVCACNCPDCRQNILNLTEENKKLLRTIANLNKTIEEIRTYNNKQSRYNMDYHPYGEDEYDR